MAKRDFRDPFRRAYRFLRRRTYAVLGNLDRHTDEAFSEEPVDFSAPSVPYYENLASRLNFARIVLYMALLVFVIVTVISNHRLITYENLGLLAREIGASTKTAQSEADRLSYPISSTPADFADYRGGLVIAGAETVTVMSSSGRKTLSVNVDYADPEVRAADRYFLTFDRGEPSFAVYNSFLRVHRGETEFPVYDASVADDGTFAILTRSRTHTSEVLVYDKNMKPLFALRRAGYVTGIALSPNGETLGVVSVEDSGGVYETKITLVRIAGRITEQTVSLKGPVGSTCGFTTNDRFAVLFSDRLMVLKPDATITAEVKFEGKTPLVGTISGGHIAVLSRADADHATETLVSFDHNGRKLAEVTLSSDHPIRESGGVDELAFGGNILYVRTRHTLLWLDSDSLAVKSRSTVSRDTVCVLPIDGNDAMVCTPAYADRVSD